ncbi:MAG: sigma-70 family RNA polymerase sigma factor [Microthrixaceae bacterium]
MSDTATPVRKRSTQDPVGLYLEEIGRHPLLTPQGEQALARSIAEGRRAEETLNRLNGSATPAERRRLRKAAEQGREAADLFVKSNLRLVVSVAKRYQSSGVPLLDLIQEGNLGLMRAVEKFDAEKGFRFSTYAVWWIRQFISRGIAGSRSSVRLPSRANDELLRLRETTTFLEQTMGRAPELRELAEASNLSEERITELLRVSADPVSLSGSVGEDGGAELGDFIEDVRARAEVEDVTSRLLPEEFEDMLSVLDERERTILRLRYGFDGSEPLSVAQVADEVGLSRERIRQLEHRGLAKLLHPSWRAVGRYLTND